MQHITRKLMMTLALLMTAVAGAWATEPTVYSGPVAITSLQVGDILAPGFSLTGEGTSDICLQSARWKMDGNIQSGTAIVQNSYITYNSDGTLTIMSKNITPVDGDGNDGNAWEVTATSPIILAGTTYDPNAVNPTANANEWSMLMPAGNVLLTVAYKDRTATTVYHAGDQITAESSANDRKMTGYIGFDDAFAEQIQATVQNIEPTFSQGLPVDLDDATFTYTSSDATVIAFQNGTNDPTASGALEDIKFLNTSTQPVTLTVQYTGTTALATSKVELLVTVAEPATLKLASNDATLGTVEAVMPESGLQVKQVTQEMVANWDEDQTLLTASDLPDFQEVSADKAHAWTGAPTGENVSSVLYYGFDGDKTKYAFYNNGSYSDNEEVENLSLGNVYNQFNNLNKNAYYTTGSVAATILATSTAGQYKVLPGSQVTLKVMPTEGNELKEWTEGIDLTENEDGTWSMLVGEAATTINLTATFDEKTFAVKMAEPTDAEAANWTIASGDNSVTGDVAEGLTDLKKDDAVTLTYGGRRKVKSVTAVSDIVPVDPKKTALTIEAITDGTITVSNPREGMKYSTDGGKTKTAVTADGIPVQAGQKVQFYGTASGYYGTNFKGSGEGFQCKVYGNIMSLISETDFATATTLTANNALSRLFSGNTTLTDASGLLLPAMTLSRSCYEAMFLGCSNLTAAPELPAKIMAQACYMQMFMNCAKLETAPELKSEQLAMSCYSSMFYYCSSLTTAPVLPAATLPEYCYSQMFQWCSKIGSVTCLATNITATACTNGWLTNAGTDASAERKLHIKSGQNTTDSNWQLSSSGEDGKRWTAVADAQ